MNSHGQTICLAMIVKNEATVIERCLASVRPLIDHWVIVDTGSDDGTQDVIKEFMRSIPGELHERPWVDFARNRTEALQLARPHGDYSLIIDADDTLVIEPEFALPLLDQDSYGLLIDYPPIVYHRPQLLRSRALWRYAGVLHEFPVCGRHGATQGFLPGLRMRCGRDGARSKHPDRYRDDATILERALLTEKDPFLISRYRFYLAQSYRDCGEREKALENYDIRAGLGYWDEEVFFSLFQIGKLKEKLGRPLDEVLSAYRKASDAHPKRAEALHAASRLCRVNNRSAEGYELARRGLQIPPPNGGLFVEPWVYDYGLLDELAVNACLIRRYDESLAACERLLREGKIPTEMRGRIEQNGRYAREKIEALQAAADPKPASLRPAAAANPASAAPRVLLAILAKQKERVLPFYLLCIEALDYPKQSISLYVRTNNNTDRTATILRDWVARVGDQYADVEFDASDVEEPVEQFGVHEWNQLRFKVLGRLRYESMQRALRKGCAYYFIADVDNFIVPNVLRDLISLRLPIVAPLIRHADKNNPYSNFHEKIDSNGYYAHSEEYYWLLNQRVKAICQLPVVHCTYLVHADVIPKLSYDDGSYRSEYVIFSDHARKNGVQQYLDNREVYGYLTLNEDPRTAMTLLGPQIGARILSMKASAKPLILVCCSMHSSGSTWMYNLVREICLKQGVNFVSCHQESEVNLPWDALGSSLIIVKTHDPTAGFRSFLANADVPAVITVRDPRDAVASLMQRFQNTTPTFEVALDAIGLDGELLVALTRLRRFPIFRYEDGFIGSGDTFDQIAILLGVTPSAEQKAAILAGLAPAAVRQTISALEAAGAVRGEEVWDEQTQWHSGHLGDGRVGKYRDMLTPVQQSQVLERTREFCECFGYAELSDDTTLGAAPADRRRSAVQGMDDTSASA